MTRADANPITTVPTVWILYPVLTSIPVICVKIQNKLSLAWDATIDPAPMDRTTSALAIPSSKPNGSINGTINEAVVISATVDDPWAIRMVVEMMKGSRIPILASIR